MGLKKIKLFGKINNKITNKINIILKKENAFDIFLDVIKIKEQKYYNDFIYLQENNILNYSIIDSEEEHKKICFEYKYNPNSLDGNVTNQKCLNIINAFQLINKVL